MKRTNDDRVKRIAIELSLKPFGRDDGTSYEDNARRAITAWRPLLEAAQEASFMLWVADGSDILEWSGDLDQPLEWGRYVGFCNSGYGVYDERHHGPSRNAILYDAHPREMRYADLAAIVAALRAVGEELLGRRVTIGATFDPGPEFAESPFKYERHPEIILSKRVSGRPTFPMVDAAAALHADPRPYAAYPEGIPEGEPFARFLGAQIAAYCQDLNVDYCWLSNGFGFSAVAWDYLGPGFDGARFLPQGRARQLQRFKQAWADLKEGNPNVPLEVRGSNFAAGMDIAKDGIDYQWLYESELVRLPPPNSPWGVLNQDYGLEIAGLLSRAVASPHDEVLFRYYPNDPWFWQNPWTDVFNGQAYDVYLPLATSIVNASGAITTPSTINVLTGDTEYGETDALTGVQVAAQIRTALNDRPDDVGLITWVYPFEAYHRLAATGADGQAEVFFGDWFVRTAINHGLPVATAGTPAAFDALLARRQTAPETICFLPTAAAHSAQDAARLFAWLRRGIPALLYGPAASLHASVLETLALELDEPLNGPLALHGARQGRLLHDPIASGGGIRARFSEGEHDASLLYSVAGEQGRRAYAVAAAAPGRAALYWLRGTNPFETRPERARLALKPRPQPAGTFDAGQLVPELVARLGYTVQVESLSPSERAALMLWSRHDNAWFLSGYAAAPVGTVRLRFPVGAPVFHATHTRIDEGASIYPLARVMHHECRVFVQQERGIVGCDTAARDEHHGELTLHVSGLEDATVVFLPPPGARSTFEHQGIQRHFAGEGAVSQTGLSGDLLIRW